MKTLGLTLILLGATLVLTPASAKECASTFEIVGKSDNLWHVGTATNPTLTACPGQSVTLKATSESGVHNIQVTGVSGAPAASDAIDEGASFDYTFTAPASGSGQYVCQFHSSTMKGTLNFAATDDATTNGGTPATGETKDSPGLATIGIVLAALGAALVIGRRKA